MGPKIICKNFDIWCFVFKKPPFSYHSVKKKCVIQMSEAAVEQNESQRFFIGNACLFYTH